MKNHVDAIIWNPRAEDLPLLEMLVSSGGITVVAAILNKEAPAAEWFTGRGIGLFDDLESIPGMLPGQLLIHIREGLPFPETLHNAASRGLLVINREVAVLMCGPPDVDMGGQGGDLQALKHFNRLVRDYLPTSRHSTTSVKLAACLTEAAAAFNASGAVIMTGKTGGETLALIAQHGAELPSDFTVASRSDCLLARCFTRGKPDVREDLSGIETELLPGIEVASAALLPIKSGRSPLGALVLWSNEANHAWDLTAISPFAYYIAVLLEVDQLGDKLEENLVIDPLTGLHNRKQFEYRLHQEVHRAERYTLTISLIIFDIDNLDEYNSTCGHMLGNLALSDIASIFQKGAREVDFVARIGGDEFALILPETNRLGAIKVADRLRGDVASYPFPIPDDRTSASLTVSAGISSYPGSADNEHDLLTNAYRALGSAKAEGTDSIKLWEDSP
ncbi:MAG: GGDEF domain-containing protein [Actinobacteria bacterium]|nr:GGDEF domain-containing protein [Actinomycetota bacterium]MCG2818985.1 GGDEF domain-containing protein [Actinomycetes bacterium]MBU4180013.1 GGDEF domain-containing protein [Actinomycetota bacterium]MBU4217825.1 GGDEF domain-containing protein [Actinomycetota bacterium]MBU4359337.1 GGDEF domain-containing protein [Actinomycetota bacterium]